MGLCSGIRSQSTDVRAAMRKQGMAMLLFNIGDHYRPMNLPVYSEINIFPAPGHVHADYDGC